MEAPTAACIIGAGPGGIAMAYNLKHKVKCDDFVIVDENAGAGGTWFRNSYPGCGCDVPSHFYSFSFALNPDWSRPLCEQGEILEYLNNVIDRFSLRGHLTLSTAVVGAVWIEKLGLWEVEFKNETGYQYKRRFNLVISACGIFSRPKYPDIPGMDTFKGRSWHSGAWDWNVSLADKRVAVVGNGCSGCQIIPAIAPRAKQVTHFARSKQWLFDRPNQPYSAFSKWLYRTIPGWMRWNRFRTYLAVDALFLEYVKNPRSEFLRASSEKEAREYMIKKTPKRYLDVIMPDYPVGCKRRVLDPGYLDSLHRDNVALWSENISAIDETGILTEDGTHQPFDVIVYATGFYTQQYLSPMTVIGQDNKTLTEHWKETKGCQAYMGTTVSGFPNFAILFGPNASPAHNSVIYTLEVQAEYVCKTFMEPILTGQAQTVVVKRSAEDYDCNGIQQKLKDSVWHAGCTNWTLDENGRNCTSFPGYVRSFWWKLYSPRFQDYILKVGLVAEIQPDSEQADHEYRAASHNGDGGILATATLGSGVLAKQK
ncbi:hypothetical protein CLAIMM_01808 [Cladophialophora immunda]|nr:hypothetical protein CLAIMM_01808 [Cladophialophora immunda]